MALVKYSDVEVLGVVDSDEDNLICNACGGIMKKDGIIYVCSSCKAERYWIRRDDEQSADN